MTEFITIDNYRQHKIGGKAERLFEMQSKGLDVPPLFCVDTVPENDELDEILSEDTLYSVRSAAFCEDGNEHSFAGQFDTFLFVKKSEVREKISDCFLSAKSDSVISYCKQNGLDHKNIKMTVIVQQMISADISGVIFSANPQGILNETVIVAGLGSGDKIVGGKESVTTCYYNRTDKKYYCEGENDAPELSGELIEKLILICEKAEEIFSGYCDIEFSVEGDRVFVLQCRPITSLDDSSPLILDNSNIVESYPGISLPLTISFVKEAYAGVFRGLAKRLLRKECLVAKYDETFLNMTGSANGRIYYKISNWYTLLSFLPFTKKIIPVCHVMMGVSDKKNTARETGLTFGRKILTYFYTVGEAFSVQKNMKKLNESFCETEEIFEDCFTENIDLDGIKELYKKISDKVLSCWDITLLNDMYAFIFTGLLKSSLKKSGEKDFETKTNDYISGISNLESMKPVKAMFSLADMSLPFKKELAEIKTNDELSEFLSKEKAFGEKFKEYISLYGDRSPEELKLETISFRENPMLLAKKLSELTSDAEHFEKTKSALLTEKAHDETIRQGKFYAKKASKGIMNREISRLNRTRIYGMVRSMFLKAGEIFALDGSIENKRDIFYLTKNEIFYGNSSDFKEIIKKRKSEYDGFKKLPTFSRIIFCNEEFDKKTVSLKGVSSPSHSGDTLFGSPCSQGKATAQAVVVRDANNPPDVSGKIIVAKMTDPGWVFLLSNARGIISEKGSLLSHTAIISRELKIPAVVGVKNASEIIKDGDILELDGNSGTIKICRRDDI